MSFFLRLGMPLAVMIICSACLTSAEMTHEELDQIIKHKSERARILQQNSESIRKTQPDFADWVIFQQDIYAGFIKAVKFDFEYEPNRLKTTLTDWESLLSRMEQEFDIYRNQINPAETGKINVKDFGAKGDGVTGDSPAFRRAFAAANAGAKRWVFIPAGRYLIDHEKSGTQGGRIFNLKGGFEEGTIFHLKGFKDVLISGEKGTVLVARTPRSTVFKLENCDNVRLENFHRTSLKPVYTTGIIVASKSPDILEVKIDKGELSPLDPIFKECDTKGIVRIVSGETLSDGVTPATYSVVKAKLFKPKEIKDLGGDRFLFKRNDANVDSSNYEHGMRIVLFARDHRRVTVSFDNCRHCRVNNVSLNNSSAMAFYSILSDATFITNCTIKAEKGRIIATGADGFYSQWGSLGSYVAKNEFSNLGDDYFNFHSISLPVNIQDGDTIYVTDKFPDDYLPRLTQVSMIHCPRGQNGVSDVYFINSVERVKKTDSGKEISLLRIKLDRIPEEMKTTSPVLDMKEVHKLRAFKKEKYDLVYFPDLHCPGTVIAGNKYSHGPSRILPFGSSSMMIHNRFDDNLDIHVLGELLQNYMPWWTEAYYSRNITIKHNYFKSLHKSVLSFDASRIDPEDIRSYLPHCYIADNTFDMLPGQNKKPVIIAKGNDDLEITGNKFNVIGDGKRGATIYARCSRLKISDNSKTGNIGSVIEGNKVTLIKAK